MLETGTVLTIIIAREYGKEIILIERRLAKNTLNEWPFFGSRALFGYSVGAQVGFVIVCIHCCTKC